MIRWLKMMFWILLSFPYWLICGDPAVDWMEKKTAPYRKTA